MRSAIAATSPVARAPFGVLFRFQILHFNLFSGFFGFFSLCHFHSPVSFVSFSNTEFLRIVLGRNSRLGYLIGSGVRYFFDHEIGWEVRHLGGCESWRIGSKTTAFGVFFRLAARAAWMRGRRCTASSFGVFFRFQVLNFDFLFAFFSPCHLVFPNYLFFGLFVCVVSLTPKGTCCPPLTSFSGIRSSR